MASSTESATASNKPLIPSVSIMSIDWVTVGVKRVADAFLGMCAAVEKAKKMSPDEFEPE
jgi:hypothetical protein